jgi:hypothetical protein
MNHKEDTIELIIRDEKLKRYYNKMKKHRFFPFLPDDPITKYPSKTAYFEIEELYRTFFTAGELRNIF